MVERIRRAGAIIGKTNVPEFGLDRKPTIPSSALRSTRTINRRRAAAAAAARPSRSRSGCAGCGRQRQRRLAPKSRRVQQRVRIPNLVWPGSVLFYEVFMPSISVHGPMARTVPDLAMFLSVIAGYDARTPLSICQDRLSSRGRSGATSKGRDRMGRRLRRTHSLRSGRARLGKGRLKESEALGCTVETAALPTICWRRVG